MSDNDFTQFWELSGLSDYVAIDLETTGLDPDKDDIIELGAVRFRNGFGVERFERLVNPMRPLPSFITELTGINDKDLKNALPLDELAPDFIQFVGSSPIVGQNIAFDLGFLSEADSTSHHFTRSRTIPLAHDTGLTARFIFPCFDGYGLANLSRRFKTAVKSNHRAAKDAEATGQLFAILLEKLCAVPLNEISTGFRFVEGTASPLANTLRSVRNALDGGFKPAAPVPDPLAGPVSGRNNIYTVEGDKRPETPASEKQLEQLLSNIDRFKEVMPGYQLRREQIGMAARAAKAFADKKILVVEAGTGVGKSMGYLIPALLSASRVVIATFTRNLQDQLFYEEIPRLGELFKFGFSAVLLKGRRNYVCRTKWKTWSISPERITSPVMREKAALISRWVEATNTGDIAEISAVGETQGDGFYRLIVSESGYCRGNRCSENRRCPLMSIRRAAQKGDLLVVNHSLVMADLMSETGILGGLGKIVFDEAHHIEDVATDQFGSDLIAIALKSSLDRVFRLCRRGSELWVRITADREFKHLNDAVEKAASDAGQLTESVEHLFNRARSQFESRISSEAVYSESFRYRSDDQVHQALDEAGAPLLFGMKPLRDSLVKILTEIGEDEDNRFPPELTQELQGTVDEINAQMDSLILSLEASDTNRVYWVELPPDVNRPVRLKSAPLDVSAFLAENLWKHLSSAILTSATLTTSTGKEGFNHILTRLGLTLLDDDGRLETEQFGSPFDFQNNCMVCYPSFLPSPAVDYAEHCRMVAEICSDIAVTTRRGMLMLFTSYDAMRRVERDMKQITMGSGVEILVQSRPGRNERLVRRFKRSKGAVLMGTDSLWEGIDIPGEALQLVVIPRLPFGVPNDPILAARIDQIRENGGRPFPDFQLPSAVLRLRQGSGRLIRTTEDRGAVLVLDARAVTKSYGINFRRAVPGKVLVPRSGEELKESVIRFFQ